VKILFIGKTADATAYFRCELPAKYLAKAGHDVRFDYIDEIPKVPGSGIKEADCEWADVIVFQRPITDVHYKIINIVKKVRPDKLIVGEYDDDYGCVPNWNPGYAYIKAHDSWWKKIVPLYDGVITSTEPLKTSLSKMTDVPFKVIPNSLDFEVFDALTPLTEFTMFAPKMENNDLKPLYTVTCEQFNELMKEKIVVYWAGSRFHYFDLDWIAEEVKSIAKQDEDIVFCFVGYITHKIVNALPVNRLFVCQGMFPVSNYYRMLKGIKKDIGIAPVDPCEFNESKSPLKIMEAMALGTYPIASEFDTYENDIQRGSLAGYEKGDWANAILEAAKRIRSGEAKADIDHNSKAVREIYDPKLRAEQYIQFFETLIDEKKAKKVRNESQIFDNHPNG
jgi:glycosyltransferase involved in cell wall biosynthesis